MRKVVGSTRAALIQQFLSESVVMCVLALVIGVGVIAAALPFFNDLAGKEIAFATMLAPGYVLGLIGITLLVGGGGGATTIDPNLALPRARTYWSAQR